jgi:hypothetical protein
LTVYSYKKPSAINSVSISMLLGLGLVVYAGSFLIPIVWPVLQLGGIMRGVCNQAYRISDDEALRQRLLREAARTGLPVTARNFELVRVKYTPAEVQAEARGNELARAQLEKRGKEFIIRFDLEAEYRLPVIDKPVRHRWRTEKRASLRDEQD